MVEVASMETKGEKLKACEDVQVDTVASTLSDMEVDSAPRVALDALVPKITDKEWKVRKEAYEDLQRVFDEPSGTASPAVLELFPKMCDDANASALEAAFAAVLANTLHVEPVEKEVVPGVMARVTDKGLSTRPGIVKLCEELTDAFIAAGAADETIVALLEGTSNRKPKVPLAYLACILEALKAYGPRVVSLQSIKKALPKLMEGPVKARPIAMSIMVEIHRWTGPALLQDVVANLRPVQQTEFEAQTKDVVPGQVTPMKFVQGLKPTGAPVGASGKTVESINESREPVAAAWTRASLSRRSILLAKLPKTV